MNLEITPSASQKDLLRGLSILVVDDSSDYRDLLTLRLRKVGASVKSVDSGFAALEEIKAASYDVILMDIQMPKMDGLRTIRRMRESGTKTPIITVTALKDILALSPAETRDIAAHAGKPNELSDLVETIRSVLDI